MSTLILSLAHQLVLQTHQAHKQKTSLADKAIELACTLSAFVDDIHAAQPFKPVLLDEKRCSFSLEAKLCSWHSNGRVVRSLSADNKAPSSSMLAFSTQASFTYHYTDKLVGITCTLISTSPSFTLSLFVGVS